MLEFAAVSNKIFCIFPELRKKGKIKRIDVKYAA